MVKQDPYSRLEDLARHAEDHVHPLPPEQIRRLGNRRRHRRHATIAAAALAAVVLSGGALASGAGIFSTLPPPIANTPQPTVSAAPQITMSNLPTEDDLEYHEAGDWKISDTFVGVGQDAASRCFQQSPEALGTTAVFRRNFSLFGEEKSQIASSLAMQFPSTEDATAAVKTMATWADDCVTRLEEQGHQRADVGDWQSVETPIGTATFVEISSDERDDPGGDDGVFEAYGLVQNANRVALVDMTIVGPDNNWSYGPDDETGLALHPMFRSLPQVAERLSGSPSTKPTKAPTQLTPDNLLSVDDVPVTANEKASQVDPDEGRPVEEMSVCQQDDLTALGATEQLSRKFDRRFSNDPDNSSGNPLFGEPDLYTSAVQFPDAETAMKAYDTYTAWIDECQDRLDADGYTIVHKGELEWSQAQTDADEAKFTEFGYILPGESGDDGGYWESIGLTLVNDRLMVTVSVFYSTENYFVRDPNGNPAHPQYALLDAAAQRLAD